MSKTCTSPNRYSPSTSSSPAPRSVFEITQSSPKEIPFDVNAETRWKRAPFSLDVEMGNYANLSASAEERRATKATAWTKPLAELLLLTAPQRKVLQRSLGRCATPRRRNSSPSKGDTSPLLLKNKVSEAAFGLLNRGLPTVTKPDLASSRQTLRSRPAPVLARRRRNERGVQKGRSPESQLKRWR